MDTTLWILIYSKFSPSCNELFSFIQRNNITTPFKLLEIDNKIIRNKVLADKRFSIKSVPCIISLNSAGVASQYEGAKAFELVNAMKKSDEPQRDERRYEERKEERRMPVVELRDIQPKIVESRIAPETETKQDTAVTMIEDLVDIDGASLATPKEEIDTSMLNKGDRSVSASIKGEKISVSSVLAQAQKGDNNPLPRKSEMLEREEPPKQTGAKVNISSIMASSRI